MRQSGGSVKGVVSLSLIFVFINSLFLFKIILIQLNYGRNVSKRIRLLFYKLNIIGIELSIENMHAQRCKLDIS